MINNDLMKYRSEIMDKMIKERNDKEKSERQLSYFVLGIIGISIYFNTLVPIASIFLIFYYYTNKDKIIK